HADLCGVRSAQEFADYARAPMRLSLLEPNDQALHRLRQVVGVAHRPARAIAQRLEPVLLVTIEDFVAGLARDPELATDVRHRLAVQKPGDKPQALLHDRTLLPRHRHLPWRRGKCYPCVRY